MQKRHIGLHILAYTGLFQVLSIPPLANSPDTHRIATGLLLAYEMVLAVILSWQVHQALRRGPIQAPLAILFKFEPRFWTGSNTMAIFTLCLTVGAAWESRFLPVPITVGATVMVACTVLLYRLNRGHWRESLDRATADLAVMAPSNYLQHRMEEDH